MERRKRRSFTPEFRAEAVRLEREGTKSLPQVAKDLERTESALRLWVKLSEEVAQVHQQSRGTYGSPWVHAEMRARRKRRSVRTTDSNHSSPTL